MTSVCSAVPLDRSLRDGRPLCLYVLDQIRTVDKIRLVKRVGKIDELTGTQHSGIDSHGKSRMSSLSFDPQAADAENFDSAGQGTGWAAEGRLGTQHCASPAAA